jgi:diguanylate cyclase (GGDEF)-like protein/PAS domain S-box-containing protein
VNISQITLQTAVGSIVVESANWNPNNPEVTVTSLLTVVAAGLAMHLVNSLAVGGLIALETGLPFLQTWIPMLHGFDMSQRLGHIAQWSFAALAADLIESRGLGFALLVIPLLSIYITQLQHNRLLRQTRKTLQGAEVGLANAQRIARLGSWEWEIAHNTWHWSDELFRIFGMEPRAIQASGTRYLAAVDPEDRAAVTAVLDRVRRNGKSETIDYRVARPDNLERVVHLRVEASRSSVGEIQAVVGTVLDVTQRKQLEAQLRDLAYHDPVTGLSNRINFLRHLADILPDDTNAVLFIDLDDFKSVNDRLGHEAGDLLLVEVGNRLCGCLRDRDLAARLGGDEFTILLEGLPARADAEVVAQRVLSALTQPFEIGTDVVSVTPSIGVVISSPEFNAPDDLLRAADHAMYQAKRRGKARYTVFDPLLDTDTTSQTLAQAS